MLHLYLLQTNSSVHSTCVHSMYMSSSIDICNTEYVPFIRLAQPILFLHASRRISTYWFTLAMSQIIMSRVALNKVRRRLWSFHSWNPVFIWCPHHVCTSTGVVLLDHDKDTQCIFSAPVLQNHSDKKCTIGIEGWLLERQFVFLA
jgi:hypothetical protein